MHVQVQRGRGDPVAASRTPGVETISAVCPLAATARRSSSTLQVHQCLGVKGAGVEVVGPLGDELPARLA